MLWTSHQHLPLLPKLLEETQPSHTTAPICTATEAVITVNQAILSSQAGAGHLLQIWDAFHQLTESLQRWEQSSLLGPLSQRAGSRSAK